MGDEGRHGMFLLRGDELVGLDEAPYDSEDLLQRHLAAHPDLLAGHQMDPGAPRRWLLVDREVAIPDAEDSTGRWSLDHLFLDQDGTPTLVEVKRSTDTRLRREVVGQVLEYAANALAYLPVERIRAVFEAQCQKLGREPDDVLAEFVGVDGDPGGYWDMVADNVARRRLRLVFLADVIPPELARIVEYLNDQMRTTEVLAVELKHYQGQGLRTLVPRVIGAAAPEAKRRAPGEQWTWDRFAATLSEKAGPDAVAGAGRVLAWAQRHGQAWFGRGTFGGFVAIHTDPAGTRHQLFELWSNDAWEFYFQHLKAKGPFTDDELRDELRRRLNEAGGLRLSPDVLGRRPSIPFGALGDRRVDAILAVFEWAIGRIDQAARG